MTDIDTRCAAIIADIHAQATTLRRSLGQRFRKIERDSRERFDALLWESEYARGRWDRTYAHGRIHARLRFEPFKPKP